MYAFEHSASERAEKSALRTISVTVLQVLVCAVILMPWQSSRAVDEFDKRLEKAKRLIDAGKPQAARPLLRELIRKNPKSADAHMQLGAVLAALAEKDQYDEAIAEEKRAIELDAKSFGARRILGMIYANQRKFDEAIALLQDSASLNPSSFAVHRDLGSAYLAAGKVEDAIAAFRKAAALNPTNVGVHLRLATIFSKQEKYADAISESAEAVRLDESKAEAHLSLANAKLSSGDAAGSLESFHNAIAANGFDSFGCKNPVTAAAALSGLGWASVESKGQDTKILSEAIAYQRKAIKSDPHFLPAYVRLAQLQEKQNKPKDAEALYKRLLAPTKFDPSVGVPYARLLSNAKRTDEARAILRMVLDKHPSDKQASAALSALN